MRCGATKPRINRGGQRPMCPCPGGGETCSDCATDCGVCAPGDCSSGADGTLPPGQVGLARYRNEATGLCMMVRNNGELYLQPCQPGCVAQGFYTYKRAAIINPEMHMANNHTQCVTAFPDRVDLILCQLSPGASDEGSCLTCSAPLDDPDWCHDNCSAFQCPRNANGTENCHDPSGMSVIGSQHFTLSRPAIGWPMTIRSDEGLCLGAANDGSLRVIGSPSCSGSRFQWRDIYW